MTRKHSSYSDDHDDSTRNFNGNRVSCESEQITPETKVWVGTYDSNDTNTFSVHVELTSDDQQVNVTLTGAKP